MESRGVEESRSQTLQDGALQSSKTKILRSAQDDTRCAGDDTRLREQCQEFEALFLGMLFREMQSTVPKKGLLPLGTGGEIYQSLWAQEVGRAAARSSPLGIATMLLRSLSHGA
jgi:flagellar protein FlgJ